MKMIKVIVKNSKGKIVYGNEGLENDFKSKFIQDINDKGFNTSDHDIVWTDTSNKLVSENRKKEYDKQGLSFDSFIEMFIEGDNTAMDAFKAKRATIKTQFPKSV